MTIVWRDTDLKTHEINLENAVDVKIDGLRLSEFESKGLLITTDNQINVSPLAANSIIVSEKTFK